MNFPPAIQGLVLFAALCWFCFKIFRPLKQAALPYERGLRTKQRVSFGIGIVLGGTGIPIAFMISNTIGDLLPFWPRELLAISPALIGCGFLGYAIFLSFKEDYGF